MNSTKYLEKFDKKIWAWSFAYRAIVNFYVES